MVVREDGKEQPLDAGEITIKAPAQPEPFDEDNDHKQDEVQLPCPKCQKDYPIANRSGQVLSGEGLTMGGQRTYYERSDSAPTPYRLKQTL